MNRSMIWMLVAMFGIGCIGDDCVTYYEQVCSDSVSSTTMSWTGPGGWSLLSAPSVSCDFYSGDGFAVMLSGLGLIDFGANTDMCVSTGNGLEDCQMFSFYAISDEPNSDNRFSMSQASLTTWWADNHLWERGLPDQPYRLDSGGGIVVEGERVMYEFFVDFVPEEGWSDRLNAEGLLQSSIHVEGKCSCTPGKIRFCKNI